MKASELSLEDGALIGLASVGPDRYYKHFAQIIDPRTGEIEQGARGFELAVLDALVEKGFVRRPTEGCYALTHAGAARVQRVFSELGT